MARAGRAIPTGHPRPLQPPRATAARPPRPVRPKRRRRHPRPAGNAQADLPDGLTQREAEILGLIARGLTNPEIAAQLFLSSHTIKTHINRIFTKTGSRDRIAAARYAQEHNLG